MRVTEPRIGPRRIVPRMETPKPVERSHRHAARDQADGLCGQRNAAAHARQSPWTVKRRIGTLLPSGPHIPSKSDHNWKTSQLNWRARSSTRTSKNSLGKNSRSFPNLNIISIFFSDSGRVLISLDGSLARVRSLSTE